MTTTILDVLPLWAVFAASVAIVLSAAEVGFRMGRLRNTAVQHENEPTVGGIAAAELGLLAFLLAFTFGLAATRFEARRTTLLDESNAIGTTFLRAKMLPEPERNQSISLLREYVDVRLGAVQQDNLEAGIARSNELQGQLWTQAMSAAQKDSRSIPMGLYVQSLNQLIDLHAQRLLIGVRSRIPVVIWFVLVAVAALSFGTLGYQSGLTGGRRSPAALPLALTFATVLWMVIDLDRPQEGLLRISQQPMIDLRRMIDTSSESTEVSFNRASSSGFRCL